jgi:hypothetical protein
MFRYKIGQDEFEDYYAYEILHEKQFTKEEFLNICKEAFNKLDVKIKKEIIDSYSSQGTHYVIEILTKEYGVKIPDKIIATIHLCELHNMDGANCEDCSKSFYINGNFICTSDNCILKE